MYNCTARTIVQTSEPRSHTEQTEQARKKGPSPRSTQHSFVLARRLAIVAGDNDGFGVWESQHIERLYLKSVDHKKKSSFDVHCTTREHGRGPTHLNAYLENENNKIFVRVESAEVCAMQ